MYETKTRKMKEKWEGIKKNQIDILEIEIFIIEMKI